MDLPRIEFRWPGRGFNSVCHGCHGRWPIKFVVEADSEVVDSGGPLNLDSKEDFSSISEVQATDGVTQNSDGREQ